MSTIPQPIHELAQQRALWEQRLCEWSAQNSGSDNAEGLEAMLGLLRAGFGHLPETRLETLELPGSKAKALLVTCRSGAPLQVLLSGHYDTVYGASHSFQRCTRETPDKLRGPGVADMKGGILVMLAALTAFEACPGCEGLGWQVLLTPDEETGSLASRELIQRIARGHRLGLVFEPARGNGDLVKSRSGTAVFTATAHGRAAHAARVPNDGRNAILGLAEFLLQAARLPERFPGALVNVGDIRGGGAVNIVPDFAEARLNLRTASAKEAPLLEQSLRDLAASFSLQEGLRIEITGSFDRMPKECGPVESHLFAAWQQAGSDLGHPPFGWQHSAGGSDGNLLSDVGLPNLDGLGIIGDQLHSEREYCELPSLTARAQIAALVLHRLATGHLTSSPC